MTKDFVMTTEERRLASALAGFQLRFRWLRELLLTNLVGALIVAALMSTQFLAQPFVWEAFQANEIFAGWLLIFRDRAFVTETIAILLCVAEIIAHKRRDWALASVFVAVVLGASLAELLLSVIDPQSDRMTAMALTGRVLRWSIVAGGACLIFHFWRQGEEAAALDEAAEVKRARAERVLTETRIEALQRQIEPHFLFNTLATVRRLQRSSPDEGRRLLTRLMDFLQANFEERGGAGRLDHEIDLVAAYLDVCAMRMAPLLTWSINVPLHIRSLEFPRFGLATLVENAVKHGIAPSVRGGTIVISASEGGGFLEVTVVDTGAGFSTEHGTGIGLANISEHLRLRYGTAASLTLTANTPSGVCAAIRLPVRRAP